MTSQYPRAYRGMQIHAVPDNEKAYDASGRKLPWGYAVSGNVGHELDSDRGREAIEKGPFGRSMRRARGGTSRSRSKTAEPKREEDRLKAEQLLAEDAVFGSLRKVIKDEPRRDTTGEADSPKTEGQGQAPVSGKTVPPTIDKEPTEILLYGFGEDLQWAAIDFYERMSDGFVLEDYDRTPPGPRFADLGKSYERMASQKSLGKAALRKKNRYAGGKHWIKITFDSRGAAELACARSPHIIKGHLVYAEPFLGRGPARDEPIYASQAGVQVTGALPPTFAITQPVLSDATSTITSETAQGGSKASSITLVGERNQGTSTSLDTAAAGRRIAEVKQIRGPRIEGAVPAKLLSADLALMPKQPKQSWIASLGARELIGSTVPRKDDGSFDWDRASFYWIMFWLIDCIFRTDLCGLRGD